MIKDFIKQYIAPLLKSYKFKKKNYVWNSSKDNFIQVVDFQLSSISNEEKGQFTINIGIFDSNLWQKCWNSDVPKFIKEVDCFPRFRIGEVLDDFSGKSIDYWWDYHPDIDKEKLAKDIIDILENKCFPFLDSMMSYEAMNHFYTLNKINLMPIEKIYLAIIKHEINNFSDSTTLLNEVSSISESWNKRVETVRTQLQ